MNLSAFIFVLILFLSPFSFAKRLICTATINSSEERESFKKNLDPKQFDFVELTELKSENSRHGEDWFNKACESNIQCDVLIISGHFGGTFFSENNKDLYLSSTNLEKQSCRRTCDGILKNPKEVFLFGCNTLATKDKDHRTPDQYLQVLLNDGISRREAEQIVQARYGGLGSSFRDRMQRVFSNVPVIHGFDSVGPSGKNVKPLLDKYFKSDIPYHERLDQIEAQKLIGLIQLSNNKISQINSKFKSALKPTSYTYCSGLSDYDGTSTIREKICMLYDQQKTQNEKLAIIEEMLLSTEQQIYIPSITDYFNTSLEPDTNSTVYQRLKNNIKIKSDLENLSEGLIKSSPSLYAELLEVRLQLGYLTDEIYKKGLKDFMKTKLKNLDTESVDLLCSMSRENSKLPKISANDFPQDQLKSVNLAKVMNCLKTDDINITRHVLEIARNPNQKNSTLYSLAQLPGMEKEILALAKNELNSTNKDLRFLAHRIVILKSDNEDDITNSIKNSISTTYYSEIFIKEMIETRNFKNEKLATELLQNMDSKYNHQIYSLSRTLTPDQSNEGWMNLLKIADKNEDAKNEIIETFMQKPVYNKTVTAWAVDLFMTKSIKSDLTTLVYLSSAELDNQTQQKLFTELEKNPQSENARYYRGLLKNQKRTDLSQKEEDLLRGPAKILECKKTEKNSSQCKEVAP